MNDFTRGIPLERFDNVNVQVKINNFEKPLLGLCQLDLDNEQIIVRGTYDYALWIIDFNEIHNLRFQPSGIVHDYYWDERGDMIHVPEKGEWNSHGFNKVL